MYTVHCKGQDAKTFTCERFQVNHVSPTEHEIVMEREVVEEGHKTLPSKMIKVTTRERQGTSAYHCESAIITDADGNIVNDVHSDGTVSNARAGEAYNPETDEVAEEALDENGPTLIEYVKRGYTVDGYPPTGYAAKPYSDDELAEAKAIEATRKSRTKPVGG